MPDITDDRVVAQHRATHDLQMRVHLTLVRRRLDIVDGRPRRRVGALQTFARARRAWDLIFTHGWRRTVTWDLCVYVCAQPLPLGHGELAHRALARTRRWKDTYLVASLTRLLRDMDLVAQVVLVLLLGARGLLVVGERCGSCDATVLTAGGLALEAVCAALMIATCQLRLQLLGLDSLLHGSQRRPWCVSGVRCVRERDTTLRSNRSTLVSSQQLSSARSLSLRGSELAALATSSPCHALSHSLSLALALAHDITSPAPQQHTG